MKGFYVEYEGENCLCTGRAVVIAETPEEAVRLAAEHQDSPNPFPFRPDVKPEVEELDISRPGVIYNDPGL